METLRPSRLSCWRSAHSQGTQPELAKKNKSNVKCIIRLSPDILDRVKSYQKIGTRSFMFEEAKGQGLFSVG